MIRRSGRDEAETPFQIQRDACVAAFAHISRDTRVVPLSPNPLDVGYSFFRETPP